MPDYPSGAAYAKRLAALLPFTQGPGQYAGGEPGSAAPPEGGVRLRVALAYPDLYAVGMSHLGLRVLYDAARRTPGVAAERVFAPAPDLEAALAADGLPLATLESHTPLPLCDVVAVSLSYELCASGFLSLLVSGGLPPLREDRRRRQQAGEGPWPLVVAGGQAASNPEPFADFVDAFFLGEGEESFPEALALLRDGGGRLGPAWRDRPDETLAGLARKVAGTYVPSAYAVAPDSDGALLAEAPVPGSGMPFPVRRRVVADLEAHAPPARPVVPVAETVHDRVTIEIMRGCPNGCRFCLAGYLARPARHRRPESICAAAQASLASTGYDEIGLLALSASDYPGLEALLARLDAAHGPAGVSLSLPSLRADTRLPGLARRLRSVRPSGLTIAPEAGTDRLRRVINKHITDRQALEAAGQAFASGYGTVKLYFMVGLPTETDEDVTAIARLCHAMADLRGGRGRGRGGRGPAIKVSVGNFVPKPHTPFQWEPACPPAELERRHRLLAGLMDRRRCDLAVHDPRLSLLEAAIALGDRRLGRVMLRAHRAGARLDAWSEHFRPAAWAEAFGAEGLSPERFACRRREPGGRLPWDHLDFGVAPAFLARERARALAGEATPACGPGSCAGCGAEGCENGNAGCRA